MTGLEYQHIGHDPAHGKIALWCLDERYRVHEHRWGLDPSDPSWLEWSHERLFPHVRTRAVGRVELDRRAGSIYIADPGVHASPTRIERILRALEGEYSDVRWFLFGAGFRGESVLAELSRRLATELNESAVETAAARTGSPQHTPEIKLRRRSSSRR